MARTAPVLLLALAACAGPDAARLHAVLESEWEDRLERDPLLATTTGDHRANDRLPSVELAAIADGVDAARGFLDRLEGIDRSALDTHDRISYDMFRRELENRIADFEFNSHLLPLTVDNGFHIAFARLPNQVPLRSAADYDNYIARLDAFPTYVEQHIALLREGLATGMSLPRIILDGYEVTIETHIVDDARASVFYAPFAAIPNTVPEGQRDRLAADGVRAIEESVVPAYRTFLRFMLDEYVPNTRTTIGASALPNGEAYYDHLIERFTTLDLTAAEVHQIGLDEVARIRAEMEAIIEEVEFNGSFDGFLTFLRTDPRFYADTPEELLKEASFLAKKMDARLPALFATLPRLPYGVEPVPDHLAPKYTGGRYVGAPLGGTRPGFYWVNTYALDSRPLYVLPSLTLHEAVPGHHLQNALRQELEGLPAFRRFGGVGAFGEGWGLYSEWLGIEAGMYPDPYSNFGRLTYEMWRACRLVVDTGMHAMGWTRQQTMDFLASNTALSLHEIRTETDRYISWPGQALGYKLGELTIRELRARAEQALGEAFDVRTFHDAVLLNGPVPLPVLEEQIDAFIASGGS